MLVWGRALLALPCWAFFFVVSCDKNPVLDLD